jgi:CBS domain-containing protein
VPLIGELFLSEIVDRPVLDLRGEEVGRLCDLVLVRGEPLPKVSAIVIERKKRRYKVRWADLAIFNKRIISIALSGGILLEYKGEEEDLLAARDILDHQIVDADGVKVVRANDIKIEGLGDDAVVVAVDVGFRGLLRRMGIERLGVDVLQLFRVSLPYALISWNYIQPLQPKLSTIALTVPRQMVSEIHPADLAELISQVSPKEGAEFVGHLDVETAAEAITELSLDTQAAMIADMDTERAAEIIEEMPPDAAADLIRHIPAERARELFEHIERDEARDIQELLGHENDTAGGLMTNEFIGYPPGITVREAMVRFREDAPELETIYYIYVIDEQERFLGVLSLKELLLADPDAVLSDIMTKNVKSVRPEADEMEVAETVAKYNLLALPVTDCDTCLVGVVTIDDIVDRLMKRRGRRRLRGV